MNKQVSVQYAYKKDGKGERHGDEAERMLAAQARKHNVRPPTQQIPPAQFPGGAGPGPSMTPGMPNGDTSRPVSAVPPTSDLGMGRGMPPVAYQTVPPLQTRPVPAPTLATPPAGLPARPPPSQAGYGGPQSYLPPGFNGTGSQPPFAPQGAPPGAPVPGFGPPGFGAPVGTTTAPPPLPPGFQQTGHSSGR